MEARNFRKDVCIFKLFNFKIAVTNLLNIMKQFRIYACAFTIATQIFILNSLCSAFHLLSTQKE